MFKRGIRYFFRTLEILLIILLLWCVFNNDLVSYGIGQGIGQLKIVWNAKPIKEVLDDPAVPDSVKAKLLYIEEVKKFAIDSLGLKASKNYTTLYDQHGKPILWVLTASEKYKLKNYEWKFPVIGTVGYKGFFDIEKGKKEEKELKDKGYDTDLGEVSAWSTLGWFRDPILSSMLRRKEGSLAELIIHEMTHATLYVPGNVDFNENLASFVGEEGAILFLKKKYGAGTLFYKMAVDTTYMPEWITPKQLEDYQNMKEDYDLFTAHFLNGKQRLDSLYSTFTKETTEEMKSSLKQKMILEIVEGLKNINFHNPSRAYLPSKKENLPNNTYFLSFTRYDSKKEEMKKEMKEKFFNDLKAYIQYLKGKYKD